MNAIFFYLHARSLLNQLAFFTLNPKLSRSVSLSGIARVQLKTAARHSFSRWQHIAELLHMLSSRLQLARRFLSDVTWLGFPLRTRPASLCVRFIKAEPKQKGRRRKKKGFKGGTLILSHVRICFTV